MGCSFDSGIKINAIDAVICPLCRGQPVAVFINCKLMNIFFIRSL